MFKNLTLYRIAPTFTADLATVEAALQTATFTPCGPTQGKSIGWVPPRGEAHGPLVESVAGQWIARLMIETKSVPGSVVRKHAQAEADRIEAETGRKPGKKEMKALREDALLALLPAAHPRECAIWVWINMETRLLAIDTTSPGKLDEVVTALVNAFRDLSVTMLQTQVTPQTGMTQWLSATDPAEWPGEFSIERECELKSGDEEKSVVKFSRHNLATDEIRKHITEGKLPTRLAMSYAGRVGFLLTEGLQLKKIAYLDGVFDGRDKSEADGFDTDVTLATGEMLKLVPDLIEALGGEMVIAAGQPVAPGAAPAVYIDGQPDPLLDQARDLVIKDRKPSISYIQRKLQIGYNRAARLLEDLETLRVVGPMNASGVREVLA